MKDHLSAAEITIDLFRRLGLRFNRQGHVLLREVGNGAGVGNSGWSDAIAMSIWPSKGLQLFGFEIKATRSDWLRELDKPDKNGEWQAHCHEWYVVAPKDVVQLEELPAAWGLMVPKGADGLRIASRCEREVKADSVPLELVAAVFRAAQGERDKGLMFERTRIREEMEAGFQERIEYLEGRYGELNSKYSALCDALGESTWRDVEKVAAKAELVAAFDVDNITERARLLVEQLRSKAQGIEDAMQKEGVLA